MSKTKKVLIGKTKIIVYDDIFKQKVLVLLNYTPDDYLNFEKKNHVKNAQSYSSNFSAFTTTMILLYYGMAWGMIR
jgi:hypothetical protein